MHKFHRALFVGSFCMIMPMSNYGDTADATSGIQALMTPEQYAAIGLHKLSEKEREELYRWLRRYAEEADTMQVPAAGVTRTPAAATAIVAVPTPKTAATVNPAPAAKNTKPAATEQSVSAPPASELPVTTPATTQPPAAEMQTSASTPSTNAADDKYFGLPAPPLEPEEDRAELHASVLPPFRGWNGKTVFKLDNGQVWKQRSSGRHTYTGTDTRVVISQNRMGFFEMRLLSVDRSVGVKRVR